MISFFGISQAQSFNKTFGNNDYEFGESLVQLPDSSYVLVGTTSSFGSGNSDALIIGIDKTGEFIWQRTIGGSEIENAEDIASTEQNLFILGTTNSDSQKGYDIFLMKTDLDGTKEWYETYGGEDWDFGYELIVDSNGDVIIAGETFSDSFGENDAYVIKVDGLSGEIIWEQKYGGLNEDCFYDLTEDIMGNLWYIGYTNNTDSNLWVLKTDHLGNVLQSYIIGDENAQIGRVITTDSNDHLLFGYDYWKSNNIDSIEPVMVNIDLNFDTLFIEKISETDRVRTLGDIEVLENNNISLVTNHTGNGLDGERWIYDASGNFISTPGITSNYGDFGDDYFNTAISTLDGGLAMIGSTNSWGIGYSSMWMVKLDSDYFAPNLPEDTYVTLIPEIGETLFSIYPNPSSDFINIDYREGTHLTFEIYNHQGQLIQNGLVNHQSIDISTIASGIYSMRLLDKNRYIGSVLLVKSKCQ